MKKRILLLTTIYPSPDLQLLNSTNVCHYFAKEWVKLGYEVKVVFNYPVYTRVVHTIADFLGKRAASIGQSYFITKRITELEEYEMDGVQVLRAPLYKILPKTAVKRSVMNKQLTIIKKYLDSAAFIPDYIVAHFCYPHLEMVTDLKQHYQARAIIVNHIQSLPLDKYIGKKYPEYLKEIDVWGHRSKNIKKDFEKQFGVRSPSFICHSGVPKEFIAERPRTFTNTITKFIYVGSLIKRKHPLAVLQGLVRSSLSKFTLTFIGEGIERNVIDRLAKQKSCQGEVELAGNIPRVKVIQKLDAAECFIMISKGETFGLVYLEAMGRGLITIASKGEGMDDIIVDGQNGFFCKAGDAESLAKIIDRINQLSVEEKQQISNKAIETARAFSDEAVAVNYLKAITG